MTANDSKSYYYNTYYHSINIKPINDDYSASTEKIEIN